MAYVGVHPHSTSTTSNRYPDQSEAASKSGKISIGFNNLYTRVHVSDVRATDRNVGLTDKTFFVTGHRITGSLLTGQESIM